MAKKKVDSNRFNEAIMFSERLVNTESWIEKAKSIDLPNDQGRGLLPYQAPWHRDGKRLHRADATRVVLLRADLFFSRKRCRYL